MNILFYSYYSISLQSGGTEKATLAQALMVNEMEGITCYHFYSRGNPNNIPDSPFVKSEKINNNDAYGLAEFLKNNKIDVLINEGNIFRNKFIDKAIECSKRSVKKIFVHHYSPGDDAVGLPISTIVKNIGLSKKGLKNLASLFMYPLLRSKKYMIPLKYRYVTNSYDDIVLLSSGFIDEFRRMAKITDKSKFRVIPNILSFDNYFDMSCYEKKEKIVLILGRMDEHHKNISSALRIWREIEKDEELKEWRLDIVGTGPDEEAYKKYAEKYLKRVCFKGRQMPEKYYQQSFIFMMTSNFEGFGIVLLEAQQKGCVPMAYDTYLALHDIITNGENGIIIPPFDEKLYAEKLSELMKDKEMRMKMAAKGIETCERYSFENVSRQWHKLIEQYM